jgi:adenosylcobyric acid synthase
MKALMVQGTSSGAGKTTICTALCRIFSDMGYSVAPFKALNISLNSCVASDGGEIASAQNVQAIAARTEPVSDMNPVLLKPDYRGCHIIISGRYAGRIERGRSFSWKQEKAKAAVRRALDRLSNYDIVVMEGSGSPAEINLAGRDIANAYAARIADASVMLVSDIDRGGAFASVLGTWELLDADSRSRTFGFLFNRLRGNERILRKGTASMERRTGMDYLGSVPFLDGLPLPEEDSLSLRDRGIGRGDIGISAVRTPFLSNYSDFAPLMFEKGISFRFANDVEDCRNSDLIIVGGSKNSSEDLRFLRREGFDSLLLEWHKDGRPLLAICGGYQMLSREIIDSQHMESGRERTRGVGIFNAKTEMQPVKTTSNVEGKLLSPGGIPGMTVKGYELHFGRTETLNRNRFMRITKRDGRADGGFDGEIEGSATGTYVHGLFSNRYFFQQVLDSICEARGIPRITVRGEIEETAIEQIALAVKKAVRLGAIMDALRLKG